MTENVSSSSTTSSSLSIPYDVLQRHCNLYDVIPKPSNQPTLAYDGEQAPVLLQHLLSNDPIEVQRALNSSYTLLGKYDNVNRFTEFNVVNQIVNLSLLNHYFNDYEIRKTALKCIELILKAPHASRASNFLVASSSIAQGLQDTSVIIRQISYQCIINCMESIETIETIISNQFVPLLITRILEEISYYNVNGSTLTDLALYSMYALLLNGTQANVMDIAVESNPSISQPLCECFILSRPSLSTIQNTLLCLSILCTDYRGKKAVLKENNIIDTLLDFINYGINQTNYDLAISSGTVIMGLMAEDDGKRLLLDTSLNVQPLIKLLNITYGTRAIITGATSLATIAAHPRGRAHLVLPSTGALTALNTLLKLTEEQGLSNYSRTTIQRAINVIEWKP